MPAQPGKQRERQRKKSVPVPRDQGISPQHQSGAQDETRDRGIDSRQKALGAVVIPETAILVTDRQHQHDAGANNATVAARAPIVPAK